MIKSQILQLILVEESLKMRLLFGLTFILLGLIFMQCAPVDSDDALSFDSNGRSNVDFDQLFQQVVGTDTSGLPNVIIGILGKRHV